MNFKESFSEVLPLIERAAPTLAGAIGGPIGAAAGYVIPILASVFSPNSGSISDIVNQIKGDPDATIKLNALEQNHGDWINSLMKDVNKLATAEINIKLAWQQSSN